MNKFIKEQLLKCKVANIPDFNDTTTHIFIPKTVCCKTAEIPNNEKMKLNACYLVKLEDYIINPYPGFTLHDNWNKGIIPKYSCMKIFVKNKVGKMIQVDGIAFDVSNNQYIDYTWQGWLPEKSINIICEL